MEIGLDILPEDEDRLAADPIAHKHLRTTHFIVKRFSNLVADMTEAGEPDSEIITAATDVANNVLRLALMACIARRNIPYHQAGMVADRVLVHALPSMHKGICDQIEAWAVTSRAMAAAHARNAKKNNR